MEIIDAELRLGPPGSSSSSSDMAFAAAGAAAKKRSAATAAAKSEASGTGDLDAAPPASKVQVVGWPPVGAYRKSTTVQAAAREKGGLYVKVSMDGAPYLRKVDLRNYGGYKELRDALAKLFGACSGCDKFAVAYEDKDGDLMLAGDVPWEMFICSCKKLRIMRGSEAR